MDYSQLPEHMQEGARLYIERGVEPGSFMLAVLCNKLVDAFQRADPINMVSMPNWASWLYNQCPRQAWGTLEKVEAWIELGGMKGDRKRAA